MPVQQTRSNRSIVVAVLGLTVGIVAVLGLFVVAIPSLTEEGKVTVQLGDDRFPAGPAEARAASIERDGPILFSDVASGQRDIYLQHVGDDAEQGWLAFDARLPGRGRECTLVWQPEQGEFTDPCDGTTVPADGEGLAHYPAEVVEGEVVVDLNAAQRREAEEREEPSTTTSILITGERP